MIAFDTSFLLDYLDGVDVTAEYLSAHDEKPLFAPALCLFEVYRGAARVGGEQRVEAARTSLEWAEPLPLNHAAAREAALIEAELLDGGHQVNLGDTLIAGICRHHGSTLVTADRHFERVAGLDVENYRETDAD